MASVVLRATAVLGRNFFVRRLFVGWDRKDWCIDVVNDMIQDSYIGIYWLIFLIHYRDDWDSDERKWDTYIKWDCSLICSNILTKICCYHV